MTTVDPVTFEILRHRLWQITDEMAVTLKKVSGSPSVTEVQDINVSLFRKNGDIMTSGWGIPWHITSAGAACRHIVKKFGNDISEGDDFIVNDPYVAAIHCPDIYMISPIHYRGELMGWCANFVHVTDIGAVDPGGFSPSATEVFQEGLRFEGIRIVEKGKLRRDLLDAITHMTREPGLVGLDITSQIAANNVAKMRFRELVERYGVSTINNVMDGLIRNSEAQMRSKLRELPDGSWKAVSYMEVDGKNCRIPLTMTKKADSVVFDLTGASPQINRALNCTYWGLVGGVCGAFFSIMCEGISWNEGILKCLSIKAPKGTIVNCNFPAPVSISTVGATAAVACSCITAMSKMLLASEGHKGDAFAVGCGCAATMRHSGKNQEGSYYVSGLWDHSVGSGGAKSFEDGLDTSGGQCGILTSMRSPNIETTELRFPLLYLFRRHCPDSGGPGKFRGGTSGDCAVIPYSYGGEGIKLIVSGWGVDSAGSAGLSGGYPGSCAKFVMFDGTIGEMSKYGLPAGFAEIPGHSSIIPPQYVGVFDASKILYVRWAGGGGYGNPIEREPKAVLADVMKYLVSVQSARDLYGVVIDVPKMTIDEEKTQLLRHRLQTKRVTLKESRSAKTMGRITKQRVVSEHVDVIIIGSKKQYRCSNCHFLLSDARKDWKLKVPVKVVPLSRSRMLIGATDSDQFILREFSCPSCGRIMDVEMVARDEPFLIDKVSH